jgi:hypothetical protein
LKGVQIELDETSKEAEFVAPTEKKSGIKVLSSTPPRIILPTLKGMGKADTSAIRDGLLFESFNAKANVTEFKKVEEEFGKPSSVMTPKEFGRRKAEAEMKETTVAYGRALGKMESEGIELSEQGQKDLLEFKKKYPAIFEEGGDIKDDLATMVKTRHNKNFNPEEREGDRKDERWLTSGDIYFYLKTRDCGKKDLRGKIVQALKAETNGRTFSFKNNEGTVFVVLDIWASTLKEDTDKRPEKSGRRQIEVSNVDFLKKVETWMENALGEPIEAARPLKYHSVLEQLRKSFQIELADIGLTDDMLSCAKANASTGVTITALVIDARVTWK